MNYTLLHLYNVLSEAPADLVNQATSLEELALSIWEI
jgi:hypothetical protein